MIVSNNSSWWPLINSNIFYSYWSIAASVVLVYDWVLTLGQEIELIWRQRWSLMTVLYLVIRYIGIPITVMNALENMSLILMTDERCNIMNYIRNETAVVVTAMLGVIMIARLHAMYQRSTMMFIFLVITCSAVNITCVVLVTIVLERIVAGRTPEGLILSGTYMCDLQLVNSPTGLTIRGSFSVLIKSHVLYFASFATVSCFKLVTLFPSVLADSTSIGTEISNGTLQVLLVVQKFLLGPRLILSVREYHAKIVADYDTEISMNSIVFQERVYVPTNSIV
ncbi:hypothetical protein BDR07DRAFT_1523984 [Suillus spraguei]|nr:hypothetical protein BDR07DRAFT_1523984 [Suillus spraguei]